MFVDQIQFFFIQPQTQPYSQHTPLVPSTRSNFIFLSSLNANNSCIASKWQERIHSDTDGVNSSLQNNVRICKQTTESWFTTSSPPQDSINLHGKVVEAKRSTISMSLSPYVPLKSYENPVKNSLNIYFLNFKSLNLKYQNSTLFPQIRTLNPPLYIFSCSSSPGERGFRGLEIFPFFLDITLD